jgi:hypothetical protein
VNRLNLDTEERREKEKVSSYIRERSVPTISPVYGQLVSGSDVNGSMINQLGQAVGGAVRTGSG